MKEKSTQFLPSQLAPRLKIINKRQENFVKLVYGHFTQL